VPRAVFDQNSLAPLMPLLRHPLVQTVLAKAVPIKQPGSAASVHTDVIAMPVAPPPPAAAGPVAGVGGAVGVPVTTPPVGGVPPVAAPPSFKLATRGSPGGVPLHALLQSVQARFPTVNTMSITSGKINVGYSKTPDDATRAAVAAMVSDPTVLSPLAARFAPPTDLATLRQRVLDASLNDFDWLRAFRQLQVATLAAGAATPATSTRG
jgi:hypothetical protein